MAGADLADDDEDDEFVEDEELADDESEEDLVGLAEVSDELELDDSPFELEPLLLLFADSRLSVR